MPNEKMFSEKEPGKMRFIPHLLLLAIVATIAGVTLYDLPEGKHKEPNTQVVDVDFGKTVPEFAMKNLDGETVSSKSWEGKVVLLNFWASWCPPCLREIPVFSDFRDQYHEQGFEVVGIAIDELESAQAFLDSLPQVKYPQLIGFSDAIALGKELGNDSGGLPFSALIDRDKVVRFIKKGTLHKEELQEQLQKLL